jgi:hypothetical protein
MPLLPLEVINRAAQQSCRSRSTGSVSAWSVARYRAMSTITPYGRLAKTSICKTVEGAAGKWRVWGMRVRAFEMILCGGAPSGVRGACTRVADLGSTPSMSHAPAQRRRGPWAEPPRASAHSLDCSSLSLTPMQPRRVRRRLHASPGRLRTPWARRLGTASSSLAQGGGADGRNQSRGHSRRCALNANAGVGLQRAGRFLAEASRPSHSPTRHTGKRSARRGLQPSPGAAVPKPHGRVETAALPRLGDRSRAPCKAQVRSL